ncbi:hypothetical protein [Elizabethkingia anophelis]|uniref:hypothetical protein n=1 Tax=Elizabethkingia anophelis TaxID=1117645 RepID=UPI003891F134
MVNICCLLDACTAINLIHIDDENDFILKKLEKLDFYINEVVFNEIKDNVYARLDIRDSLKYSNKEDIAKTKKIIEKKLTFFRGKKNDNNILLKELGTDFFERIKVLTNYTKRPNGELCSTAYGLYISRCDEKKIFFYTDDIPAKDFFAPFFDYQQIGHIKDSVDLIILLYWLDEKFTEPQIKKILSDLHSQYSTDVTLLLRNLQSFQQTFVDAKYRKSYKDVTEKLSLLIHKLQQFKFQGISEIKIFFESKRAKHKNINEILDQFSSVFDLDNSIENENLLEKIKRIITQIDSDKVYKLLDLCSA